MIRQVTEAGADPLQGGLLLLYFSWGNNIKENKVRKKLNIEGFKT